MSLSLMATMLIIYYIILFIKISSRCELNVTKDLGPFCSCLFQQQLFFLSIIAYRDQKPLLRGLIALIKLPGIPLVKFCKAFFRILFDVVKIFQQ